MKKYSTEKDLQDIPTVELELQVKEGEWYLRCLKKTIGEDSHHYHETAECLKMLKKVVASRYH